MRAVVGDGSIPPPRISRPIFPIIGREHISTSENIERPPRRPFINPLQLFFYPEVTLLLFFNGVVYAVFYGVTASISTLFQEVYPFLSETDVGLCFLAIGGGMLVGTLVNGKILDREYRVVRDKLVRTGALTLEGAKNDENFPIEYARFRLMPIWLGIFSACCVGYGWALQERVSLAIPLLMQILSTCYSIFISDTTSTDSLQVGYTIICVMNTTQTLLVDMLPSQGSSITACVGVLTFLPAYSRRRLTKGVQNNLARCSLGAGMVSVIDIIIRAVDIGWTYVILGALCVAVAPIIYVVMQYSPRWRANRRARQASAEKREKSVSQLPFHSVELC